MRWGLLALAGALLASVPAAAQEPSPADVAQARAEFQRGVAHLRQQSWDEACAAFGRSNALVELPATHLNLAACHRGAGRLLDESEHLRSYLRLAGDDATAERRRFARERLEEIEPRIPKIVVVVPDTTSDVAITVSDRPVPRAAWNAPRPINPGTHAVRARSERHLDYETEVVAEEGQVARVEVRLVPRPREAAREATPSPALPPPTDSVDDGGGFPWVWVTVAVLAAAAIGVTVFLVATHDPQPDSADFPPGAHTSETLRFP